MNQACGVCGRDTVFTTCADCRMQLCDRCARFELLAEGCGTVVPAYFCPSCVSNPLANPNAIFWQMKEGK
jgi:hypothetical protein